MPEKMPYNIKKEWKSENREKLKMKYVSRNKTRDVKSVMS